MAVTRLSIPDLDRVVPRSVFASRVLTEVNVTLTPASLNARPGE